MLFSGTCISSVSWSTNMACLWLNVPLPTSCPLKRTWYPAIQKCERKTNEQSTEIKLLVVMFLWNRRKLDNELCRHNRVVSRGQHRSHTCVWLLYRAALSCTTAYYYQSTSVLSRIPFSDWLHYSLLFYSVVESEWRSSVHLFLPVNIRATCRFILKQLDYSFSISIAR